VNLCIAGKKFAECVVCSNMALNFAEHTVYG